jgi:olefin beta-lactone synthetase
VSLGFTAPAQLPPPGLKGLDPTWSRLVHVPATDGVGRTWHFLDSHALPASAAPEPRLTLLCVHGNPSWSYLWRNVMDARPLDVRVIAVDQLNMGYSERTGEVRRLATRVDDLCQLTEELAIHGPVATIAHDWGGPISVGWALRHRDDLEAVILLNTAVHQPAGSPAPSLIRAIRKRGVLRRVTVATTTFVAGAAALSRPKLSVDVRRGLAAPYDSAERREAIGDFVEDIPLDPNHPSAATLDAIADGLADLRDVPALLLWGPNDKVFSDLYLHDLKARLPHADVQRYVGASHFVSEDADVASAVRDWLARVATTPAQLTGAGDPRLPLWAGHGEIARSDMLAVAEMTDKRPSVTFAELNQRIEASALSLRDNSVHRGDRVAVMIPPGIDLCVAVYACWRLGAEVVLIDSGLGPSGMSRAIKGAAPAHLIGVPKALLAARSLRWPGRRIPASVLSAGSAHSPKVMEGATPAFPTPADPAAVVFTSGATGPSKGVRYQHRQIQAQRDALMALYRITSDDRLVAAFAPFALYGPAMGIGSVVPDMDVAAPATLTAAALGDATVAADATLVFASPAALVNVARTEGDLTAEHHAAFARVRLVLSAGAPVRPTLLSAISQLFPNAELHTPYGMTEVLPVANISLAEIEHAVAVPEGGQGACVGLPVSGVEVQIDPFQPGGAAGGDLTKKSRVMGEVLVRAEHARSGYDQLWHTESKASQPAGWHRTGDVGIIDDAGRLWIGGRIGQVIDAAPGPVLPVTVEQRIEALMDVEASAVVGVGPAGSQVVVAILELVRGSKQKARRRAALAGMDLHDRVRDVAGVDIAAVLTVPALPVDRRHNSKVDRGALAIWADEILAGGKISNP